MPNPTEHFTIKLSGPMACGKSILKDRLIRMLQDGPENHHPVRIIDGEDRVYEITHRKVTSAPVSRRDR